MSETIGGEVVPDSTRQLDVDGEVDLMIEDLDLWYGDKQALYGVSLPIAKNSVTSLIGPSGCGKTTTIGMLLGLLKPSAGEIKIDNMVAFKNRISSTYKLIILLFYNSFVKFFG